MEIRGEPAVTPTTSQLSLSKINEDPSSSVPKWVVHSGNFAPTCIFDAEESEQSQSVNFLKRFYPIVDIDSPKNPVTWRSLEISSVVLLRYICVSS